MPSRIAPKGLRWVAAAVLALLAMSIRAVLEPYLGESMPFLLAYPAMVLSTVIWGTAPGLLTSTVCLAWVIAPIAPSFAGQNIALPAGSFAFSAVLTVLACSYVQREPTADPQAPRPAVDSSLTRWLRTVLWAAMTIPPLAFFSAAWWGYEKAFDDADRTAARAADVVLAHAARSLGNARAIAKRVQRETEGTNDDVRRREGDLYQRLRDLILDSSEVEAISVWDAEGRLLVTSRTSPAPGNRSVADQDYFAQQRQQDLGTLVTGLRKGPVSGELLFNVVVRRQAMGGAFAGVIVVALQPKYFQEFYRSLASEEPGLTTFSLFKADGELLTRWPPPAEGTTRVSPRSALLARVQSGERQGSLFVSSTFDPERRLFAFRRVGTGPVYVSSGLSEAFILANWRRFVEVLAAILVPLMAGLVLAAWVALKKSIHQQSMAAQLAEEARRRAHAEKTLLESQKLEALSELTGGVAHDFNNLLAIVSNNLHVHKRLHPEVAEGAQLAAIGRAVDSGVKLTRQLLSFSRKQAVKPEAVLLQRWLPDISGLIGTTLGRSIALQIDVTPGTPPVFVDAVEFELALINLAVNARDAMPDGGHLRIAASRHASSTSGEASEMVLVQVADTGSGVAPEHVGKVFDPFFSTKGKGKGTGLGLSQVYGFCRQAGGTASIASDLGAGTTVSLLLPAASSASVALARTPERPQQTPVELRGRLLLVEDNDDMAASVTDLLSAAGLSVRRVSSAEEALSLCRGGSQDFDLALVDIVTPGAIDGIGFADGLRTMNLAIPVLLMSGYPARAQQAVTAGRRVLAKPIDPELLLTEVGAALRAVKTAGP